MAERPVIDVVVTGIEAVTLRIRAVTLQKPDGGRLPGWSAGAHINVMLPAGDTRSYSLVNMLPEADATAQPTRYRLGVRLEQPSTGGSDYIHNLRPGDRVTITEPDNHFPLRPHREPAVLLAGGIGITPIISMAAALTAEKRPHRLIYAGRARTELAFLPEIEQLAGDRIAIHTDDVSGLFDVEGLMRSLGGGEALYVCGPQPMIDAAIAVAKRLQWREGRLYFELFTAPVQQDGDTDFEVELASSGKKILVRRDQSILDALLEAGETPLFDCKRGDCGLCQTAVLEGVPDHRDYYLSATERQLNKVMQICVSRAVSKKLVLDI